MMTDCNPQQVRIDLPVKKTFESFTKEVIFVIIYGCTGR